MGNKVQASTPMHTQWKPALYYPPIVNVARILILDDEIYPQKVTSHCLGQNIGFTLVRVQF